MGIDHKLLLPYGERPAPDDGTPEAYTEEEVKQFFNALSDERHRLFFEFLLKTGVREREATTLEWPDITFGANPTITIQAQKKHLKFRNKVGKSRTVPRTQAGLVENARRPQAGLWYQQRP
jgi:integrase